jgi:hypothetical protein
MKKKDLFSIAGLIVVVLLLYYPLFFSEYAYTDELVQLWLYKKGNNYNMFLPLGRNITDVLFNWLFSSIDTIQGITRLRLFSLFGWISCIPIWYYIIKRVVVREALPGWLCFFVLLFLVSCPAFSVSVQWAACLELFIANTAGLASGYMLYGYFQSQRNGRLHNACAIVFSILFGLVSLFTYQNGFGCFFIPFVLHLTAQKKLTRLFWISISMSLLIFAAYYLIFKWSLKINHVPSSERAGLTTDPWHKLVFFFTRPMASAFHFSFLFNERNIIGVLAYALLFAVWIMITFFKRLLIAVRERIFFFAGLFTMLLLTYLPSLLVKENYASNRTLLALDITVCILFFEMVFSFIGNHKRKLLAVGVTGALFVLNAWYNFTYQFLLPVKREYQVLKSYTAASYHSNIKMIYFIRPPENLFQQTLHVTSSWDEFGVPSSFFEWVPEFFIRQVVYEKTNNRKLAESLIIKSWLGKDAYNAAAPILTDSVLVVDAGKLLAEADKK